VFDLKATTSQPMRFYTNNIERMRVTNIGNVGIGTDSPSALLETRGSTNIIARFRDSTNGIIDIKTTGTTNSDPMQIDTSNRELTFAINSSERMRIDSYGRVGIGTSSPDEKLVVSGSVNNDLVTAKIANTFGSLTSTGSGTSLQFYGWDAGVTANIKSIRVGQPYSPSALTFETYAGSGTTGTNSLAERMRIDEYGNVLVGTTSDTNFVDTMRVIGDTNGVDLGGSSSTGRVRVRGSDTGAGLIDFTKLSVDPSSSPFYNGRIFYSFNDNFMRFETSGSEKMRIESDGKVGIGTSNPESTLDLTKTTDAAERAIRVQNSSATLFVGVEGSSGNRFSGSSTDNGFIGTTSNDGLELATNNNVRMRIDSSGRITKPYQPSFTAWVTSYSATFSNTVIIFDSTRHNNGSHYNTSNGRFTAPVNGYYFFAYNVQKSGSGSIEVQFQKNGTKQNDSYVSKTDDGNGMHTANSVIWYLSSGDYVDVKCSVGTAYGDYTHFTGHLLS